MGFRAGVEAAAYPSHWSSDVVLADGGTVHVRAIRPDDADRLVEFHDGLSAETVYLRFFSCHPQLSEAEVERFTCVDHVDRVALVAEVDERLVAVGRFDRMPAGDEAEVAFVVADRHQGRGIGTLLLEALAAIAWATGISRFVAEVLPGNRQMLHVFSDTGFTVRSRFADGVVHVELGIEPTESRRALVEARAHRTAR